MGWDVRHWPEWPGDFLHLRSSEYGYAIAGRAARYMFAQHRLGQRLDNPWRIAPDTMIVTPASLVAAILSHRGIDEIPDSASPALHHLVGPVLRAGRIGSADEPTLVPRVGPMHPAVRDALEAVPAGAGPNQMLTALRSWFVEMRKRDNQWANRPEAERAECEQVLDAIDACQALLRSEPRPLQGVPAPSWPSLWQQSMLFCGRDGQPQLQHLARALAVRPSPVRALLSQFGWQWPQSLAGPQPPVFALRLSVAAKAVRQRSELIAAFHDQPVDARTVLLALVDEIPADDPLAMLPTGPQRIALLQRLWGSPPGADLSWFVRLFERLVPRSPTDKELSSIAEAQAAHEAQTEKPDDAPAAAFVAVASPVISRGGSPLHPAVASEPEPADDAVAATRQLTVAAAAASMKAHAGARLPSLFVALEGLPGSGKRTLAQMLRDWLGREFPRLPVYLADGELRKPLPRPGSAGESSWLGDRRGGRAADSRGGEGDALRQLTLKWRSRLLAMTLEHLELAGRFNRLLHDSGRPRGGVVICCGWSASATLPPHVRPGGSVSYVQRSLRLAEEFIELHPDFTVLLDAPTAVLGDRSYAVSDAAYYVPAATIDELRSQLVTAAERYRWPVIGTSNPDPQAAFAKLQSLLLPLVRIAAGAAPGSDS